MLAKEQANLEIKLYHKAAETAGDGDEVDTNNISLSSVGRDDREWSGLKELVRYKFTVANGTTADHYVLFRMLDPVWFDSVTTS